MTIKKYTTPPKGGWYISKMGCFFLSYEVILKPILKNTMHLNTPYYVGGVQMHRQFFKGFGGGLLQFYPSKNLL